MIAYIVCSTMMINYSPCQKIEIAIFGGKCNRIADLYVKHNLCLEIEEKQTQKTNFKGDFSVLRVECYAS